jgi:CRISPR/Cas system-associated protein Cas10 (large subunit of type III CRISPR-Cas system)
MTKVCWENESGSLKRWRLLLTKGKKQQHLGCCNAHYKAPLKLVLDKAREMEKKAKNIDGGKTPLVLL